ncbi:MAG: hydantoinase/oxoprolinase family protein [Candidatus Bathyarchaeia archaeon]
MEYQIGVDTGGTFTETVLVNIETGEILYSKVPTTYPDQSVGVINGIEELSRELGISSQNILEKTSIFCHGTTIATNALINRTGSKTGLITTKGFEDTTLIMRVFGRVAGLSRDEMKNIGACEKPEPIVPRELIEGVPERVDAEGNVLCPLNINATKNAVERLCRKGVKAVAVSLLWSFKNPTHEMEVNKIVKEIDPSIYTCLSSDVSPTIREYSRTMTTILNAYLRNTVDTYLVALTKKLKEKGLKAPIYVMQLTGGVIPAGEAPDKAVYLINSGPTGGMIAAQFLGELCGYKNLITTDMGGTSFDVGIIIKNKPSIDLFPYVERFPISIPALDIVTIGAGGGSIARVEAGRIKVGPTSAGSTPGPACYGRGGEEPTVTDADIVLGIIDPNHFVGGKFKIYEPLAYDAIKNKIAEPLGIDVIEAAEGIRRVVDARMSDLIRRRTAGKGLDPREFNVFAYGGAGPTHCVNYTQGLGIHKCIVPYYSTAFSALGLLISETKRSFALSHPQKLPLDAERFIEIFSSLKKRAVEAFCLEGANLKDVVLSFSLDMRYRGQVYEINVPISPNVLLSEDINVEISKIFEEKYDSIYGKESGYREAGVEVITFRVEGYRKKPKLAIKKYPISTKDPSKALKGKREVRFSDIGSVDVYYGEKLMPGNVIEAPAIIDYIGTTVFVPNGWAEVDEFLNLVINLKGD